VKIEQLPRPERIKLAKAKMEKLLDYFLYVLELHANNSFVVFSPLLVSQIPRSHAAHAFNVFQRSMYQIEIVRLCAIWDGVDLNKENIPTVVKLIDDDEIVGLLELLVFLTRVSHHPRADNRVARNKIAPMGDAAPSAPRARQDRN
jgi:hypothetical protein